jgi:leucyl-tRNA synthetase
MGEKGVDLYVGGAEHAVLHLLYARFWHKVLYDLGLVSTKEPFHMLRHQGMILSYSYQDKGGAYHSYDEIDFQGKEARLRGTNVPLRQQVEKMSKSKKNVVSPDDVIKTHGADAMRLYELFMGDFEREKPWDMRTIEGVSRFLQRVWRLSFVEVGPDRHGKERHKTIQAVTERIQGFKFNTAIAALMEYVNVLSAGSLSMEDRRVLLLLLSPFAPHIAEEMLLSQFWPKADLAQLKDDMLEYPVQINGKVRDRFEVPVGMASADILLTAKGLPRVGELLKGRAVVKEILIPGRLVNFVVKEPSAPKE